MDIKTELKIIELEIENADLRRHIEEQKIEKYELKKQLSLLEVSRFKPRKGKTIFEQISDNLEDAIKISNLANSIASVRLEQITEDEKLS